MNECEVCGVDITEHENAINCGKCDGCYAEELFSLDDEDIL